MPHPTEHCELTNLCMLTDDEGRILVQDRTDPSWPGICFPGGHVEPGESFVESVIREVREETGLTILDPILCGIKQFPLQGGRTLCPAAVSGQSLYRHAHFLGGGRGILAAPGGAGKLSARPGFFRNAARL